MWSILWSSWDGECNKSDKIRWFCCVGNRNKMTFCEKWGIGVTWRRGSPGVLSLSPSKGRITHKVLCSTGLGQMSLGQRHLSTSALGRSWGGWRKWILFLRSCLQGHTDIVQARWGKQGFGSYFCTTLGEFGEKECGTWGVAFFLDLEMQELLWKFQKWDHHPHQAYRFF